MGISLIIKIVEDIETIKSIMLADEIWKTISEDEIRKEEYIPDLNNDLWVGAFVDNECIGLFRFHSVTGVALQLHVQILLKHRKEYSMKAMAKVWEWFEEGIEKNFIKVIVSIPAIYPNVYKFALVNGFIDEGINRMSIKKNGQVVDQWLLGITREEIGEQANGYGSSNSCSRRNSRQG